MRSYFIKLSIVMLVTSFLMVPFPLMAEEKVKMGCLLPFTGPLALEGKQTWEGINIAADMQNDKGGLWGKKIEFVKGDTTTPDSAIAEAERLIKVDGMKLIIGGYSSSRTYAASEITEKYKTVYWITTAVAGPITERGYIYLYRYNAPSGLFGAVKAQYVNDVIAPKLGIKPQDLRVAIIHEDTLWGSTVADVEKPECEKLGMKVVVKEGYSAKAVDLSPLIMKLKAAKPDVVLITGYVNDTNLYYRQCKEQDFNMKAFFGSGAVIGHPEFFDAQGKDANYVLTLAQKAADPSRLSPEGRAVQKEALRRFKEKHGLADPGSLHLLGFEAGWNLFHYVLPKAGSLDPEAVRKVALEFDKPWNDSMMGMGCKYAPPGHPKAGQNLKAQQFVYQWQNDKLVAVWPETIAAGDVLLPMPTWDERK